MNMVRLTPLPEELDHGYFGRVMRINGFQSEKETMENMDLVFQSDSDRPGKRSRLELLSLTAGQSLVQFAQGHSTIPLRRAITTYLPDLPHGSPEIKPFTDHRGLEPECPGAFLCPACVSEDVMFHGVSYWRRDHQMFGQVYCPKHRTSLHHVESKEVFLQFPSMSVAKSEAVATALVDEALSNKFVKRFLDIASSLSMRPSAIAVRHIAFMLYRRATDRGYRTRRGRHRVEPLLSDLIQDSFPISWLAMICPGLLNVKISGEPLYAFEYSLYTHLRGKPVTFYILALAVLFDSAEEALNALFKAREAFSPKADLDLKLPKSGVKLASH